MCDFTSPVQEEQVLISASPDAVLDALINPEKFSQWFGATVG